MPSRDAACRARARSSRPRSATTRRSRSRRPGHGRLPRYTWRDAYAELREKLDALGRRLGGSYRVLVDANQHVDREAAARSGVGFYGKNTMLITRRHGSWVVLGTLVTDVELEATPPLDADCGECRLCIDACPTGCARRAGHARRDALPLVLVAGAGADPRRVPRGDGRAGLRLRHLPGRLPVEPRRREAARGRRRPGEAHVSLVDWLTRDADELAARYDRLYVPRNDGRWLTPQRARRGRQCRRRSRARAVAAYARRDDDAAARACALGTGTAARSARDRRGGAVERWIALGPPRRRRRSRCSRSAS